MPPAPNFLLMVLPAALIGLVSLAVTIMGVWALFRIARALEAANREQQLTGKT